jgi:hypothetical protein
MNDDYLWDGSGEPDPEIQKLENRLAKFRHQGEAPQFPRISAARQPRFWQRLVSSRWSFGLAAAMAAVLFMAAFGILRWSQKPGTTSGPGWDVESVAGTPRVESSAFGKSAAATKLGIGQTLVTDSHSKANISIADIGTVNVETNTQSTRARSRDDSRLHLGLAGRVYGGYAFRDRSRPGLFLYARSG